MGAAEARIDEVQGDGPEGLEFNGLKRYLITLMVLVVER
jgi:hypothetical protein